MTLEVDVVEALRGAGATIGTAESLTGGLVCATLVAVPGASDVVRGGVVAYAPDVKTGALGVEPRVVEQHGTVAPETAVAMATRARVVLDATYGVATTGVAGPDPSEGRPVGTVHVAVAGPSGVVEQALSLAGDRDTIRRGTVDAALSLLLDRVREESTATGR